MEDNQLQQLLGQHLRKYRQDTSLTIEKLAERLDMSANHLGRIERGESDTTYSTYAKLAVILDLPCKFHEEMKQLYKDSQA
ncbi:helix-turn-helix domain-containing protein [Virgibacillus necropolis]|uniref:helix-turn-helix domain-containing protein n=1 Tax=Virgibacillus necropolis TaxID=163877 RepID=UPI0013747EEE|nr:helix-turn-helix transcriptional regulator [Virgibacillus necropolis]